MAKTNLVYSNHALEQERAFELRVLRGKGRERRRRYRFKLYCAGFCGVSMVLVSLFCRIQLTELTEQINQSSKKLAVLESEELRLRTELENDICVHSLEEKAFKLGMEKLHNYQVEYVNVSRGDCVSVEG